MADKMSKAGKPNPPGPKKGAPAAPPTRMEQAQKRAQAMTSGRGKATPPKQFFQEAWVELQKTTWPTRDVLIKSTTVVLALVAATAVFVTVVDTLLGRVAAQVFNIH